MILPLLLALALPSQETLLVRDVTLIDVGAENAEAARLPGRSVLVSGDEIVRIGLAAELEVPEDARVVAGEGGTLIPGLFDMHVHVGGLGDGVLTTLVQHGVTSIRDLGGDVEPLVRARARIEAGELVGPRIAFAGFVLEEQGWLERVIRMFEGGAGDADFMRRTRVGLATPDDVFEAVGRVAESGADVLKLRNAPNAELLRFLFEEARLAGLPVAAHEPASIDLDEAAELGLRSLEHAPILAITRGTTPERWREIHAAMVAHGMHVTPTFVAMRNRRLTAAELEGALEEERASPRWSTLPPVLASSWLAMVRERHAEQSSLDWKEVDRQSGEVIRGMHADGVRFLAGTDLGVALVYPGGGLHEELVLLVERAGLTPLEALRAATLDAARWLGEERLGALREGYSADLVLLDEDPIENAAHVAEPRLVIARGRVAFEREK